MLKVSELQLVWKIVKNPSQDSAHKSGAHALSSLLYFLGPFFNFKMLVYRHYINTEIFIALASLKGSGKCIARFRYKKVGPVPRYPYMEIHILADQNSYVF